MFDLTRKPKRKNTTPASRVPAWFLCHVMMQCDFKSCCEKEVSECSAQLHTVEMHSTGFTKDSRSSENLQKTVDNSKATVALYLNELLIQKCKFGSQFSRHSPQIGLPQLALWHHVGVTIGITLDKNGSL